MVPTRVWVLESRQWFPRVRGDGPCRRPNRDSRKLVPPRPRGWSPRGRRFPRLDLGSPASAGMVLADAHNCRSNARFPRVRGDGPFHAYPVHTLHKVPPRPRGWSPWMQRAGGSISGSPASAGMVPFGSDACGAWRRFPRVRGDGPCRKRRALRRSAVPPRPRGWSQELMPVGEGREGSPASAGMVPFVRGPANVLDVNYIHPVTSITSPRSVPRARGDEPKADHVIDLLLDRSPRTRG